MFSVYCSSHGGQVLLGPDNIETLADSTTGLRLHWRCTCGQTGVKTIETRVKERSEAGR
ncbi:MAG TPA: hypothetical protein VNY84_06440 [Acidimicrobiales bacterium]|jgi:hypothetical protein|nr:hypothetical protein [Acidimicrobiales bacterium]